MYGAAVNLSAEFWFSNFEFSHFNLLSVSLISCSLFLSFCLSFAIAL